MWAPRVKTSSIGVRGGVTGVQYSLVYTPDPFAGLGGAVYAPEKGPERRLLVCWCFVCGPPN